MALGFMTLDELRTILAQEQAAASMATHVAAPSLSALMAPPADALPATSAPARVAATSVPAPLTRQAIADRVRAHAKANGTSIVGALQALGLEEAYHAAVLTPTAAERQAQPDQAKAYAAEIVETYRRSGFDAEESAAQAKAQQQIQHAHQYAAEPAVKPSNPPADASDKTRVQKAAADSVVALFSQAKSRTGSGDASSDAADSALALFESEACLTPLSQPALRRPPARADAA